MFLLIQPLGFTLACEKWLKITEIVFFKVHQGSMIELQSWIFRSEKYSKKANKESFFKKHKEVCRQTALIIFWIPNWDLTVNLGFFRFRFVLLIASPFDPQNDFSYRRPCKTRFRAARMLVIVYIIYARLFHIVNVTLINTTIKLNA